MSTQFAQFTRQIVPFQSRLHHKFARKQIYSRRQHKQQKTVGAASSLDGPAPTLEFAERQVQIYDEIVRETTQYDLLKRNITCYYVAAGILVVRAALSAFAQIELIPNFWLLMGFIGQQLQVGLGQLVTPTFGPPCLAAFAFLRWRFRHEMEAIHLGSFGKILETTQRAGLVHNTKIAWEKLLLSQWLIKYGLGWAILAFLASLFLVSQITNFFCADVALSISTWMSQPCLGQGITVGFLVGMLNLWITSAFIGYVIMGDIINMGSYTILKVCMKFDKAGTQEEEEEQEEDDEEEEQTNQNGVNKNGISNLKIVDLDKDQYRNAAKPQNQN
eukprot:TRINITY_DN5498_c2_g1_i1.p1 TRINITY_DN5498_c2_g1~~TRINITY_DN5498_c2_g1_i1.p1  ORF type:complete len:331 (-),score=19.88 TRINITY_DN5498_c2_g1_i1:554-1546(-)